MSENFDSNKLKVNVQYIKDLSFENPNSPKSLTENKEPPDINVDINVFAKPFDKKVYEVSLSIGGKANKNDLKIFEIELVYAGIFTLPDVEFTDEEEKKLVLIEAPQLLFPFARSIIAELTRDGGFMPLIIQPIDFAILYRSRINQKTKTKGSA
tara:strand:+ start:305 stop:766 length:462 start_codon:yes stop_codon:yes gene_type:complete